MKVLFEIICFPVTAIIWLISFVMMAILCYHLFKKAENGHGFMDTFLNFSDLVYKSYLVDFYFSIPAYARTIICLILYFNIIN